MLFLITFWSLSILPPTIISSSLPSPLAMSWDEKRTKRECELTRAIAPQAPLTERTTFRLVKGAFLI